MLRRKMITLLRNAVAKTLFLIRAGGAKAFVRLGRRAQIAAMRRASHGAARLAPVLLSLLALLCSNALARAAPPAIEAPPPELARIYFYRQAQPLMVLLSPEVIVNGKTVGDLSLGEVFYRDARPGRYRVFLSGDPDHVVEFSLAAGQIGFVRCTLRIGLGSTRLSAETVPDPEARKEIGNIGQEGDGPEQPELQR
jgi:hypothetical protein